MSTMTFLYLNSQIVRYMSLSLSPANQKAPCACAWWEKTAIKRQTSGKFLFLPQDTEEETSKEKTTRTL